MKCVVLLAGVTALLGLVLVPASARAEDEAPAGEQQGNLRARELYRLGSNAYKAGRVEEARQLLNEAWELRPSYDVAATLGQIEFELGHVLRANELMDDCLRNFPPIESDDRLTKMQAMRAKVRESVAELQIQCDCSGAVLSVDGVRAGVWPLKQALYVLPGPHRIGLEQGKASTRVSVQAEAGHRYPLVLQLTDNEPAPKVAPPVMLARPSSSALPHWPIYMGGGLVALNVAAAIGFKVVSLDAAERAQTLRGRLDSESVCGDLESASTTEQLTCGQLADAESDRRHFAGLTWYATGGALGVAAVTVGYWVWAATTGSSVVTQRAERTSLSWSVSAEPQAASLVARGRF